MQDSMEVMAGLRGGLDFLSRDLRGAVLVQEGTFSSRRDGRNSVLVFERFKSGEGLVRVGYRVTDEGVLLRYEDVGLNASAPWRWRGGVPVMSQVKRLRFAFFSPSSLQHPAYRWDSSNQALPRGVGILLTVANSRNPKIAASLETLVSLPNA